MFIDDEDNGSVFRGLRLLLKSVAYGCWMRTDAKDPKRVGNDQRVECKRVDDGGRSSN